MNRRIEKQRCLHRISENRPVQWFTGIQFPVHYLLPGITCLRIINFIHFYPESCFIFVVTYTGYIHLLVFYWKASSPVYSSWLIFTQLADSERVILKHFSKEFLKKKIFLNKFILATGEHCWLVAKLLFTRSSAELLFSRSSPSLYWYMGLFLPKV